GSRRAAVWLVWLVRCCGLALPFASSAESAERPWLVRGIEASCASAEDIASSSCSSSKGPSARWRPRPDAECRRLAAAEVDSVPPAPPGAPAAGVGCAGRTKAGQ
ncbi:hypothetical protein THAOC_06261, partial [Thalassiosira oceanica]